MSFEVCYRMCHFMKLYRFVVLIVSLFFQPILLRKHLLLVHIDDLLKKGQNCLLVKFKHGNNPWIDIHVDVLTISAIFIILCFVDNYETESKIKSNENNKFLSSSNLYIQGKL